MTAPASRQGLGKRNRPSLFRALGAEALSQPEPFPSEFSPVSTEGCTALPMYVPGGAHCNTFYVTAEGLTFFASARDIAGTYARLGGPPTNTVVVVVDYESATAIHSATGIPIAVAFYFENLIAVCHSIRSRFPDAKIVVAIGGTRTDRERVRSIVCTAAVGSSSFVAHAPEPGTFAEAFAMLGADGVAAAIQRAHSWEDLGTGIVVGGDPIPFPSPVHGAALFRQLLQHVQRFTVLSPAAELAITLWILASHVPERFAVAPILALLSLTRRSGKTLTVGSIRPLLRRPKIGSDWTAAALTESADRGETPVLDELDQYINKYTGLPAVLNGGYSREASRIFRKGAVFDVYGFKVVAGIGDIPATTIDRSIPITFIRKSSKVKVERYRSVFGDDACALHAMISRFWLDNAPSLASSVVPEPELENDRAKDNWQPLIAVASLLGEDVLHAALEAAKELSRTEDDTPHLLEEFICDLVRIFIEDGGEFISSEQLRQSLCRDEERPWKTYSRGSPITFRDLASLMRKAKVRVGEQRNDGTKNVRGYFRKDVQQLIDGYSAGGAQ